MIMWCDVSHWHSGLVPPIIWGLPAALYLFPPKLSHHEVLYEVRLTLLLRPTSHLAAA
jgi:hypothetical protein